MAWSSRRREPSARRPDGAIIDKSFLPPSGTNDRPTVQAWLGGFEECIVQECRKFFGADWEIVIDLLEHTVSVQRLSDRVSASTRLHPGMHVVTARWAAQRLANRLYLTAVDLGYLPPPPGAVQRPSAENLRIVADLAKKH